MRLNYWFTLVFVSIISFSNAQNSIQEFIDEGIELHDKGEFEAAVKQYKKALKISPDDPLANYEIGSTYYAMGETNKAVKHADAVINAKAEFMEPAYILKGSALDSEKNTKEAIKTYKKGIKSFPNSHLLHFNLALTYYNTGDNANTEKSVINAIESNPRHASSHVLLAYLMADQGKRTKILLAAYHFLLLEPNSSRSKPVYDLIIQQMNKGVSDDGNNTINISIPADGGDEFQAVELMLSLLAASKNLEENEGKSELEMFAENTDSFFTVLGELSDGEKGFWWDYYVDFYYQMHNEGHVEALCYYIGIANNDPEVMKWLKNNESQIEAFGKWFGTYKPSK